MDLTRFDCIANFFIKHKKSCDIIFPDLHHGKGKERKSWDDPRFASKKKKNFFSVGPSVFLSSSTTAISSLHFSPPFLLPPLRTSSAEKESFLFNCAFPHAQCHSVVRILLFQDVKKSTFVKWRGSKSFF